MSAVRVVQAVLLSFTLEESLVRIPTERLRPSPALIQSARRHFYRLRSTIFRTIWPID
jgi:hypothetical protein